MKFWQLVSIICRENNRIVAISLNVLPVFFILRLTYNMIYGRLKNTEYIITNCTDIKLSLKNYNTLEIVMPRLLTTIKIIK